MVSSILSDVGGAYRCCSRDGWSRIGHIQAWCTTCRKWSTAIEIWRDFQACKRLTRMCLWGSRFRVHSKSTVRNKCPYQQRTSCTWMSFNMGAKKTIQSLTNALKVKYDKYRVKCDCQVIYFMIRCVLEAV